MDDSMRLYWETAFEEFTTEEMIKDSPNPLREYESEFIDGAIIDIGCEQSNFLLEYANSDRTLYAADNDEMQLDFLKKRAEGISNLNKWKFCLLNFPEDQFPEDKYSVVILSNILHFFTIKECTKIENIIGSLLEKGTMIYISVHSSKFYANDPDDPNNNDYFKHYFTIEDIENLFSKEKYEYVYIAEIQKVDSMREREITIKWLDKDNEREGIKDIRIQNQIKDDYLKDKQQADIQVILRKL